MNKRNHNNEWFVPSESSNITDSGHNSRVSQFVERSHSRRTLYIVSGICQVLMGVVVVTLSVLGMIQPFWLSAALCMVGSVTTMIGLYLVYISVAKSYNHKSLLRNAMRRVMEAKN